MRKLRTFLTDRSGATAIEYALIAVGVSVAIVAVVVDVGTSLQGTYTSVGNALAG